MNRIFQMFKMSTSLDLFVLALLFSHDRAFGICDVSKCTSRNTCVLSRDTRSCKCATPYFGDGCEQAAKMNVVCGNDFIAIAVTKDLFKYYNVEVGSVHLSNPSCAAKEEEISGTDFYTVTTPKEQYEACGGSPVEKNITHVSYSLVLMSDPQVYENIVRDPVIKIEYKCVYPYMRSVSLPFPINPLSSETVMRMEELDAKVVMTLYKDKTYNEAFTSSPTVHLRDKVYVQVSVMEPQDVFNLKVDECWATQTPKHNDTSSLLHILLQNGCADDETVSFLSKEDVKSNGTLQQEGLNGEGHAVRFSFDMFRFATDPHEFYLHCRVHLCTRDYGETCISDCNAITKREAHRNELPQALLSYGPIRVEVPEMSKSNPILMLVLPVGVIWILAFFLLILISIAKAGSKRLAFNMNHLQ